jgi:hypothetical protein
VATWSKEPKILKAAMTRIQAVSGQMIERLEQSSSRLDSLRGAVTQSRPAGGPAKLLVSGLAGSGPARALRREPRRPRACAS